MRTSTIRRFCAIFALLAPVFGASAQGFESLTPIVGMWQSDTSNGTSAISNCAWTPTHTAVLCDQVVTLPTTTMHALSLFTFDAAAKKFVFYGLSHPGDPMKPTPLSIEGKIWTYGGTAKDPDGKYYRTQNDFSADNSYTWRQQSSSDGRAWTNGAHGKSVRKT